MKIPQLRLLGLGLVIIGASRIHAAILSENLGIVFGNASVAPSGTGPWLSATVQDFGTNTVRLTMDTTNLGSNINEYVTDWSFNLKPTIDPASLTFAIVPPNPTSLGNAGITAATNSFKADGDGYFDIDFSFPTGTSMMPFKTGEKVVVDITSTSLLSASDFSSVSQNKDGTPSSGAYYVAAHITGTGNGQNSAWLGSNTAFVAIPENEAFAAWLAAAAAALAGWSRFGRRQSLAHL